MPDKPEKPRGSTDLLPCPFCGGGRTDWVFVEETGEGYHLCGGCSARGPACFHCPDGLIDGYWNRRDSRSDDFEGSANLLKGIP